MAFAGNRPPTARSASRLAALALAGSAACSSPRDTPPPPFDAPAGALATHEDPIATIEPPAGLDPRRVALGAKLFRDPLLSGDGKVACTDCHHSALGGADGHDHSKLPARDKATPYNAPSIFNVAHNHRFNWRGEFRTLEEQLVGPFIKEPVMRTTMEAVVAKLRQSPYRAEFAGVYDEGVSDATLRDALATFLRSLVTPDCRYDRFRKGDAAALSEDEKQGYALFKSHGCISCHQGVNVGGNLFQPLGVMREYFPESANDADLGRFNVTKRPEDRSVFRVPSLRNVERTAPYFHNGATATLEEAVDIMAEVQLGQSLTRRENELLVAFLKTLTGEYHGEPF